MIQSDECSNILTGQLQDLPPLYPTSIKIYICSNFGEFDEERRFIWQEILPDLQDHCMQYGFDVIFIDMLLGNQTGDHYSETELKLYEHEIENCRQCSAGPFFLALLGDHYGNVPLPDSLEENEFTQIVDVAKTSGKDAQLVGVWYQKDENAIPPVYRLNTKFDRLSAQAQQSIYQELMNLIQTCSTSNNRDGQSNSLKRFFVSGNKDVSRLSPPPLLSPSFVNSKNNYFNQSDPQSDAGSGKPSISSAISLTASPHIYFCLNQGTTSSLANLKTDILGTVDTNNVIKLTVSASQGEIQTVRKCEFDDYLENVIANVASKLRELVDHSVNNQQQLKPPMTGTRFDCKETLVHLHHCISVLNQNQSIASEKLLAQLQSLIMNGSHTEHQLIIVKGSDENEVSSVSVRLCQRVRNLFGKEVILIPIFAGLTRKSDSIENIFRTICTQINIVLNQDVNIEGYSHKKLFTYFLGLINRVSKSGHHLFVYIHGLEKLQSTKDQECVAFDWLACRLPAKCHIVVTCSSLESIPVVKFLETKLLNTDGIVHIGKLSKEDCKVLIDQTLSLGHRKLTDKQYSMLLTAAYQTKSPTVISYLSKLAETWTSDTDPRSKHKLANLPSSLETMVEYILSQIEVLYGRNICMTLFCYLTLSRYGVTEAELLDLLSAKDSVLLTLYQNHEPLVLRFSSKAWVHIMRRLEPLLSKRYISGKPLLTWTNRACNAIVRQRYMTSTEETVALHQDFADMFLENWPSQNPFLIQEESGMLPESSERMVQPQPLVYNTMMYNMRKLQELWWHLLNSGDIDKFKEHTFCNFEYLLAMADTDGVQALIKSLTLVKSYVVDSDIHMLDLTLKAAGIGLNTSPLQLSNEIIGRLQPFKDYFPEFIEPLISQAMEWCDSYTLPLLVPLTRWLDCIHIPLVTSMDVEEPILCATVMPNCQHILLANSKTVNMYHIPTQRLVKSFHGLNAKVTCVQLNTRSWMLYAGLKDKTVNIWNLNSESCIKTLSGFKANASCIECYGESNVICGTESGAIQVQMIYDGTTLAKLELHKKHVTALELCKSDTILVSGSLDGKIIVWYTLEWVQMNIIDTDELGPILCLSISQDGTFIVAGSGNRRLHVIALVTGTVAQTIKVKTSNITTVTVCKDCHHCVAGSSTGEVLLYNFRTTELLNTYKKHKSEVLSLMLNECHQLAVSTSKNEIHVWSLLRCFTKHVYNESHSGAVNCIAVTHDNKRLVTGSVDGLMKTWTLDISNFSDNFVGHNGPVTCIALADDNTFVVSGSTDKTLKVWSLTLVCVITNYKGHEAALRGVDVLNDNQQVISMDVMQKIHLWRAEDGQTLRLYEGPTAIYTIASNSQICVSGAGDNRLQIWQISDGTVIKEVTHKDKITCLLPSKDCEYLVTGSIDKSVKVWELGTGKLVQVVVDHKCPVRCVAITESNETILSACDNGIIHLSSLSLGICEKKLMGHTDSITVLRLSADDAVLVSGSSDNTVRVWAVKQGIALTLFDTHYPVMDLVITDNAHRVAVLLANNRHVPILGLHNTPSKVKSQLTISVSSRPMSTASSSYGFDSSMTDSRTDFSDFYGDSLPVKPRPPTRNRGIPSLFPVPRSRRRLSSASSIPQIIQHSPIRAPLQSTMKEQEQRRLQLPIPKLYNKPQKTTPSKTSKVTNGGKDRAKGDPKSNVCSIV